MTQVTGAGSTSVVSTPDLGPTSSLQLMFAKLQLELAETAKSSAMDQMKAIQDSQAEQKEISALLNQARQLQADAKNGNATEQTRTITTAAGTITETLNKGDKATFMSKEMIDYMDKHDLAYDKKGSGDGKIDYKQNEEEWKVAIASLESRLEQVGTDTQQKMVFVQDYMGQYNSYLQGANTQISSSNQTLTSLARGQ